MVESKISPDQHGFVKGKSCLSNLLETMDSVMGLIEEGILVDILFFPVSCHLGPKGPNGKIVLIRFVHVHKKYKTRVGDRQRKSGYCGILAQKVSVRAH